MDLEALSQQLRTVVGGMGGHKTHETLPAFCIELGLPAPEVGGSKRERMYAAFDALPAERLPGLAQTLIDASHLSGKARNDVQDLLWVDEPAIELSTRARREIARALIQVEALFQDWDAFKRLLQAIFILPLDLARALFGAQTQGLLEDIHRHFVRNPEDADVEQLFKDLDVYALSDARFRRFLEGLVSADIQLDAETQQKLLTALNPVLRIHGAEMVEGGQEGGYPKYTLVSLRTSKERPKYLVFASQNKPDIRFRSLIDNDLEVLSNQHNDALVYDRSIGPEGLRWKDLQSWWTELTPTANSREAAVSLYRRLAACLPDSSPPQQYLFRAFYTLYKAEMQDLPALLPEVWLHWDPKTVSARGPQALLTQRMDFLMLMPGGGRVVIEVDGRQHYADDQGRASPAVYAKLAAGQRQLSLARYDVYRFGGLELRDGAENMLSTFFDELFDRYRVPRLA